MPDGARIRVEVVAAWPDRVFRAELRLPAGATVGDAIEASGIGDAEPALEVRGDRIGIFARRVRATAPLADGDRVEIYRSLARDPREARRRRAGSKQ